MSFVAIEALKMIEKLCPICEEGQLHAKQEQVEVEHLTQTGLIESHYSECDACGSEQATTVDTRFNKRAMIAFKKQTQGLLTGAQVRDSRKQWCFNQEQAAKVFGGGPVAFSKYESDDVMQSEAMDKLLRLALDVPAALPKLMADAGVVIFKEPQWQTVSIIKFPLPKRTPVRTRIISEHHFSSEVNYG
ncbi:MAG: HTH-type transcriptional regulator/antitoxin MqsA [Alteromonadaceae bacterium]|jgi:HTH-type transcriptional regulator/antitoxin MqsA